MTNCLPPAYCFFQDLEPRPALAAVFERDYLLYAIRGALHVSVAQQSWLLPPSFAAWLPAQTPIRVEIGTAVTTCSVLTKAQFCSAMPTTPTVFQVSPMARQMIYHCKAWGPQAEHPPEAEGFFQALLGVCAGLVAKSVDVQRPAASDPALQKALAFTEEHLARKITSGEVARAASMSERSLQRRFREDVGMTWSQSLTHLRMIHAVQLLAEGTSSVIQIAGATGFESLSAFNRAFLSFAGCTPTEFRKGLNA